MHTLQQRISHVRSACSIDSVGGAELHGAKLGGIDDHDIYGLFAEPMERSIGIDARYERFVWSTAGNDGRNARAWSLDKLISEATLLIDQPKNEATNYRLPETVDHEFLSQLINDISFRLWTGKMQ